MIDYNELTHELLVMQPRQQLYKVVKAALKSRGNWKDKPRGIPMQKGSDYRRSKD